MNETSEPDRPRQPEDTDSDADDAAETPIAAPAPGSDEERPGATPEPTVEATSAPRAKGRGVAIFALLLALVALAGAGYTAWVQRLASLGADSTRADLAGEISAIRGASDGLRDEMQSLARDIDQARERSAAIDTGLARIDQRLTDNEAQLARIESLPQATPDQPANQQWRRKEIEHLLRIANHQIALERDVDTALAALLAADEVAVAVGDPGLLPVRRQLADEIVALRAVERPDTEGLALRLASLARRVSDLRLSGQPRPLDDSASAPAADSGFARLRRKIAEFLEGIFSFRRTSGEAGPLLSPEQSFFLRRHLELELQTARVALLSQDVSVYRASVGAARRWTEQYFDGDDPGVAGFVDALRDIESRRIGVEYPDISGSLRVLVETSSAGPSEQ